MKDKIMIQFGKAENQERIEIEWDKTLLSLQMSRQDFFEIFEYLNRKKTEL